MTNSEFMAAVKDVDAAFAALYPDSGFSEEFVAGTLRPFMERLGGSRVVNNMLIACRKVKVSPDDTIRYFCGICHNQMHSNVVPRR